MPNVDALQELQPSVTQRSREVLRVYREVHGLKNIDTHSFLQQSSDLLDFMAKEMAKPLGPGNFFFDLVNDTQTLIGIPC